MVKVYRGTLVVDRLRGVIYFEGNNIGTLLRLEGLEKPTPEKKMIDVRIRPPSEPFEPKDQEGQMRYAEIIK